ncbi:hypothetical protein F2Q70_00035626 [Brassica cretica]|uniref:Uncharacterized protein n=1 Tax=Brassica cretica TaxID=69181 RepID=A0A8S9JSW7_BRACR|nr:hypothetical protein F2Q70_00035626 [Brassica cretica]
MVGNVRRVRYDVATELWFELGLLRSDRAEWAFGRYVAIFLEFLSDDSSLFRKGFRKEESISKKYLSKKFPTFFFFGNLDVNFFVTVFDPNNPLGPATDHRLGKLLPHQLANQTRAPPRADSSFCSSAYGVLAAISSCCSPHKGRFLRVTHPSATGNTTSRPTCMC